ncbi:hypothetical protein M231_06775 [Tremella mesenterica]|uniref:Uncharacterized protein n=1 Tax=Tremella mesenterica TaxID=5217 RepID=A0A4Q1BAY2_TREME|nr:hypothetical protein M231_06775 [Tremella mesenterica]
MCATLTGLSAFSAQSAQETSHLLRHIVQEANLTNLVFRNPSSGKVGDWKTAPAVVVMLANDTDGSKYDAYGGMEVCDENGHHCHLLGGQKVHHQNTSASLQSTTSTGRTHNGNSDTTTGEKTGVITTTVIVIATPVVEAGISKESPTGTGSLTSPTSLFTSPVSAQIGTPAEVEAGVAVPSTENGFFPGSVNNVEEDDDDDEDEDDDDEEEVEDEDDQDNDDVKLQQLHHLHNRNRRSEDNQLDDPNDDHPTRRSSASQRKRLHLLSQNSSKDAGAELSKRLRSSIEQLSHKSLFIRNGNKPLVQNTITLTSIKDPSGTVLGVNVSGLNSGDQVITEQCAASIGWPVNSLDNTVRTDITLSGFFLWILGLAIVALVTESTSHLIALLISLTLSTTWTAVNLSLSLSFRSSFQETMTQSCEGLNVIPSYVTSRISLSIAMLVINSVTLVGSAILCWKLRDHFGWQTFQRIGASEKINKIYRLVMVLSIVLQLDVYLLVVFFALWIDQMTKGVAHYYMHSGTCKTFEAIYALMLFSLIPWTYLGWKSSRTESRRQFLAFLAFSALFIAGWSASFANSAFRLMITTWAFFGALSALGVALTILSVVLACWRRTSYGHGLAEYLKHQEIPDDPFPTMGADQEVYLNKGSLPTFSTTFPDKVPPVSPFYAFLPCPLHLHAHGILREIVIPISVASR